jgi:hypothetical protein
MTTLKLQTPKCSFRAVYLAVYAALLTPTVSKNNAIKLIGYKLNFPVVSPIS